MIELSLIAITWYLTKVYYTRSPKESNIVKATCFKCARSEYIAKEHIRVPSYCMTCK